jgi:hypothetical protein
MHPAPPAEVFIYVLPKVGDHGRHSLMVYPRRLGDTRVYYTAPGLKETPSMPREILWIPSGLGANQVLTISEKANSRSKGNFGPIPPIHSHTPMQLSGPVVRGPGHAPAIWSYEIRLSDANGELASLDPDIVIVPDP